MLHDPARHEILIERAWDEGQARRYIEHIVANTEASYSDDEYWPLHPQDREGNGPDQVETPMYHGASGVIWALHYLHASGAAVITRNYLRDWMRLLDCNRRWLGADLDKERASYLMGDTPILMMAFGEHADPSLADALRDLIAGNALHPARELMWGAPGTLLAALFLHERTGEPRWADLFRSTADVLWTQLVWSGQHGCAYLPQELYGRASSYLDAVHGFVSAAVPLARGRHLLGSDKWAQWQTCIANTVRRTADVEDGKANWRPQLFGTQKEADKKLLQFCHGAPGFVICLAAWPDDELDDLLIAAGEATWTAGPLNKGSNLCHGTAGNGYAFLMLYQRTQDRRWLSRARAFAMHAIDQSQSAAGVYGQQRYSLWTGDLGLAVFLWDCIRGQAAFPTLDVFYAAQVAH
jgi:hypothetical protein